VRNFVPFSVVDVLAIPLTFVFFWIISVDPEGRALLYVKLLPAQEPREIDDPRFYDFPKWVLFWMVLLILCRAVAPAFCAAQPKEWSEVAVGALVAVLTAKMLLGPAMSVSKILYFDVTVKPGYPTIYPAPLRLAVPHQIRLWPKNQIAAVGWKLLYVAVAWAIIWLAAKISPTVNSLDAGVVPLAVVLAWFVTFCSRCVGLTQKQNPPYPRWLLVALTISVWIAAYYEIETVLTVCGFMPGHLPSWSTIIAGVLSLPILELGAGVIGLGALLVFAKLRI
jgi:hypothetical protein